MEKDIKSIGVLGGSGALGTGLSFRLARVGYNVVIGSRNPVKALKKILTWHIVLLNSYFYLIGQCTNTNTES